MPSSDPAGLRRSYAAPAPGADIVALVLLGPHRFEIQRVPVPTPGLGEVLCRVGAVTICGTDPKVVDGKIAGRPPAYPFIAGHEWAGQIVAVGPSVTNYVVGEC